MEAELISYVATENTDGFLRYMLRRLGFPQESPTAIYEDSDPTIDIVN